MKELKIKNNFATAEIKKKHYIVRTKNIFKSFIFLLFQERDNLLKWVRDARTELGFVIFIERLETRRNTFILLASKKNKSTNNTKIS